MMKVKEITAILEEIHGVSLMEDTVDGIKYGDENAVVTGIMVSCCASVEVLQKAVEERAPPRQRIAVAHRKNQADGNAEHGIEQRVEHGMQQAAVGQNNLIRAEINPARQQPY